MIHALKGLGKKRGKSTIYFAASVQEEVGLRGIRTAAYRINPDFGIPLDVTPCHPDSKATTVRIGEGPVIRLMEQFGVLKGLIADKELSQKMMAVANSKGIPFQLLIRTGGVTEGSAIHLTREGIRSCPIQVSLY